MGAVNAGILAAKITAKSIKIGYNLAKTAAGHEFRLDFADSTHPEDHLHIIRTGEKIPTSKFGALGLALLLGDYREEQEIKTYRDPMREFEILYSEVLKE